MSDTNNTPQKAVELIDIPEKVKSALTQEEMNEVISARQKAVLKANVAERLDVLQGEISEDTKKKLADNGLQLSEMAEEKGILDKAQDIGEKAITSVKQAWENVTNPTDSVSEVPRDVANVPVVGTLAKPVVASVENTKDVASRWGQKISTFKEILSGNDSFIDKAMKIFDEIVSIGKEFGSAIWAMFSGDFDKISEFFGVGGFPDYIRNSVDWIDQKFDISNAVASHIKTLLLDTKGFKDLTIEEVRLLAGGTDFSQKLGTNIDVAAVKSFSDIILDKEKFATMSAEVEKNLGTKVDEKTMKIGDFIVNLVPKKS